MKNHIYRKYRWELTFKSILSVLAAVLIITSSILIVSAQSFDDSAPGSRTGSLGNQPNGGYSEGSDLFEIYHVANAHNTSFAVSETVYIRLSTPRVDDLQGKNNLIVRSYDDTKVIDMDPAFIQVSTSSPNIYEANFTAPSTADHYLVEVDIEDNNGDNFRAYDTIIVGGGSSPIKYIKTYSDSGYTTPQTTFASYATVYVELFQNDQPNQANSKVNFRDYEDNKETKNIRNLKNDTLAWHQDNYARFAIDLEDDISWALQDGYWYIISPEIKNSGGTDVCKRWSIQILIKRPPDISTGSTSVNSPVDVIGANQVTITSHFTNPEVLPASSFTASYKLREPDDTTEILLVDNKPDGGSGELGGTISITLDTLTNIYTASYTFDPTESWTLGNYDLQFTAANGYGKTTDGYSDNLNELHLFNSLIKSPEIVVGITKCIPSSVDVFGTGTTAIYSEFTDAGNPEVSTYNVKFKIRQTGYPEIVLVKDKANGGAGEFGGTVSISFTSGTYTVSYTWDPDATFAVGTYDLYFEVDDGVSSSAKDDFSNNQNELTIINSDNIPTISVGSTTALPSSVDKVGNGVVTIYSEFSDDDLSDVSTFTITFKVRDPSNNEMVLVDKKANGGLSEAGNIVSIEFSGTIYTASITWDPDSFIVTGWYDLYFEVSDGNGNIAKDGFGANKDELHIISSVKTPEIDATTVIPSSVSMIGSGTTTIYTTFTDEKYNDVSNFTVSFKVRAPDNTVYNLSNNAGNGDAGEYGGAVSVSFSGTIFTASYVFNPPDDAPAGKYDLYSSISNAGGGTAVDDFGNNIDELKIETTENPPKISDTQCIPGSLSVIGNAKTQLFVTFTDNDNPAITEFSITFKIRDKDKNEIIIADTKAGGTPNTLGEIMNVSFSGTEYTASVFWDPPENTFSGKYDLYSSVLEKSGALIAHGFDKNKEELTLSDGFKPGTPSIKESYIYDPIADEYNFTVNYTDPDNDVPNDDGVILTVDNAKYDMKETDPSDNNYKDGKDYYYVLKLDDGDHTYGFKLTNADDEVVESTGSPLTVDNSDKSSSPESSGSALAVLLVIIIIILIVLVLLMMMKKKQRPAEQAPTQTSPQSPPVAQKAPEQTKEAGTGGGEILWKGEKVEITEKAKEPEEAKKND